jgi:[acyl-carrier-protein] S-malonyltransferase
LSKEIIVFTYPGQGSQKEGMGEVISDQPGVVLPTFAESTDILAKHGRDYNGRTVDIEELVYRAPNDMLSDNYYTQLSIFPTDVAAERELRRKHPEIVPDYVAGHSVGEYAAFVSAGIISYEDALLLVEARAMAMTSAAEELSAQNKETRVAAVLKLDYGKVVQMAREHTIDDENCVDVAVINGPAAVTVSGIAKVLEVFAKSVKQERGIYKELPISVPVHSRLLLKAKQDLANYMNDYPNILNESNDPNAPKVILNRTGLPAWNVAEVADLVPSQVTHVVKWMQSMEYLAQLADAGANEGERVTVIEVGAAEVLTGINKWLTTKSDGAPRDNLRFLTYKQAMANGLADIAA